MVDGGVDINLQKRISNGNVYLSIIQGYRYPVAKKVRRKTIKSLGYPEDPAKQYLVYFKAVVKKMNKKEALENPLFAITLNQNKI